MMLRAIWNCFDVKDRTTNSCEAYHHVINEFFIIVIQIHFDSANLSKIKKRNSNDAMAAANGCCGKEKTTRLLVGG